MATVIFSVPGEPVGKGRPRVTRAGHAYTPARTARYESTVALFASQGMAGRKPLEGGLEASIRVSLGIPRSWAKGKRALAADGRLPCVRKPDLDNVVKAILDGMSGIVYQDDTQVVRLTCDRVYADTPGVLVRVQHLWDRV